MLLIAAARAAADDCPGCCCDDDDDEDDDNMLVDPSVATPVLLFPLFPAPCSTFIFLLPFCTWEISEARVSIPAVLAAIVVASAVIFALF